MSNPLLDCQQSSHTLITAYNSASVHEYTQHISVRFFKFYGYTKLVHCKYTLKPLTKDYISYGSLGELTLCL